MYQTLLADSSIYEFLLKLDEDVATECRRAGCSCGGPLHSAVYPRKPRGTPPGVEEWNRRYSFCCARDGCRRRCTPASFRFLGRKVFVGAVVVLVSALRHGTTPKRMAEIRRIVGVSRRTVERWREWWRNGFVRTPFWKAARSRFHEPLDENALPLSLLNSFCSQEDRDRLMALLRIILPLTTSHWPHDF